MLAYHNRISYVISPGRGETEQQQQRREQQQQRQRLIEHDVNNLRPDRNQAVAGRYPQYDLSISTLDNI